MPVRKRPLKLWRLNEDGRKLFAGTIVAGSPAELVAMWSAFLVTPERGVYFATYRGMSLGPEAAMVSVAGRPSSLIYCSQQAMFRFFRSC
jgi:hypothetical protein